MAEHPYWIAYRTLVIKEVLRFSRIWVQTVLPPAITTTLYFIIFGRLIGEQIGQMDGVRYIDYIVPGLILMAVITNSYANVVSSFYQAKFQHHIEELLVSPMPNWVVLLGFVSGGVARGMVVGLLVMAVAFVFADPPLHSVAVTLVVFLLTSVLFALGGFINAVYAKSFDDITIVPNFVLTPLTYLGGVFYSIDLLSPFWQQVSLFNPVLYMVNAFRFGLLGVSDISLWTALGMILIFIMVLAVFSLRLLDRGVGVKS
ncbi:MAG: ABC transporter permease [Gammaproteobacteria bacterium SHHR-1]|uniref:ABC transporter permease n=1 Tax=Magnetovirga frankeli TaxID=947516 RepID=UPI0012934584|nr:ABC transporter permease [gamma proteobacterium SS-5]